MGPPSDPLVPADVVVVDGTTLLPDLFRPVAAVVTGSEIRWMTWPHAPLPERAVEEATVLATQSGAWILYTADDIDGPSERSAVHLGLGGVTAAVGLGTGRPVGADEHGLWVGDPRDASEWMDAVPIDDDDDDAEDDPAADLDPETLPWTDEGPFWPDPDSWSEADTDTETDEPVLLGDGDEPVLLGDGDDDEDEDEDGGFVWTIGFADGFDSDDSGDPEDSEDSDGRVTAPPDEPEPPAPTPPTDLVLIRPDGSRATVRVDHLVDGVRSEDGVLVVRYHRTGPRRVASRYGGWDVVYEPREVRIDLTGGLPDTVTTEALPSVLADESDEEDWEEAIERREAAREPWLDRFELAGVPGARWPSVASDEVARERTVARLRAMFEGLDAPSIVVWSRTDPFPRRTRSAYRNVEVTVEGEWPATEVVVTFEHTDVPFLRLRRRYRPFDDAGHPIDPGYATVYLEEDIATGAIPPRSAAVDGILEV